jgi:hypothetical protein
LIYIKTEIPEGKRDVVAVIAKTILLKERICTWVLDSLYVRKVGNWKIMKWKVIT